MLGASLLGALVGIGYQIANPAGIIEISQGVNAVMPFIIIAIALGLFLYARTMRARACCAKASAPAE